MPGGNLQYRMLDLSQPDIAAEIGRWAMRWPGTSKRYRQTLNKITYVWWHSVIHNYQPPGCWLSYQEIAEDLHKPKNTMSRKTVACAVRWWASIGVLVIEHQYYRETQGRNSNLITLHPQYYDDEMLEILAKDKKDKMFKAKEDRRIKESNALLKGKFVDDDIPF